MEGWKFWWGIAAFFLGGVATQLNGWLTYRRQRRDKVAEAEDAARGRRDEFELQHLLAASQRLYEYRARYIAFSLAAKHAHAREADGLSAGEELSEADDALNDAERALHGHVGFILDDGTRLKVRAAMDAIDDAVEAALTERSFDHKAMARAVNEALDSLATRVRQLYAS